MVPVYKRSLRSEKEEEEPDSSITLNSAIKTGFKNSYRIYMDTEAIVKDLRKRNDVEKSINVERLIKANQKLIDLVDRLHNDNEELHDSLKRVKEDNAKLLNKIKELKTLVKSKNDIIQKMMDF